MPRAPRSPSSQVPRTAKVAKVAADTDTSIPQLGKAKHLSPLLCGRFIPDASRILMDIHSATCDLSGFPPSLEEAGPRERIFFDPTKAKCAIVTCGGLCPGINDVIRAIVLEAMHNYGTPSLLGVRYGLEGLIPH